MLNPLVFAGAERLKPWLEKRVGKIAAAPSAKPVAPATEPGEVATLAEAAGEAEDGPLPMTRLNAHTILVGYGRVGSLVGQSLKQAGLPFLVIEDSDKPLARLQADGIETVAGNAAKGEVFASANAAGAKRLILAIPNAFEAGQIILRARAANPAIAIIARAHSDAEVEHLKELGADTVIMGEREIARGIVEQVLEGDVEPPLAGEEPATPDDTKPTEPPAAA
jgi:CPA2 family monovalent cation:H+ antiporter-2